MKFDLNLQPKLISSLRGYTIESFMRDLMAGLIVGIVALPLAIAFGIASGVSPEVGLVTAVIGGFMVSAFGGSTVQIGGPTGAFIVIVYGIIEQFGLEGLLIATLLSGVFLVIMGVLKLGAAIKFIPYPIIVGFTSGIALTILTTQIKDLFGLTTEALPGDFIGKWMVYFGAFDTINLLSLAVGVATVVIIILMPRISAKIPGSLMAIVLMTVVSYALKHFMGIEGLESIGDRFTINASFPAPKMLSFDLEAVRGLLPSAFTIALLCAIESLLSATVADGRTGDRHDSNMELVAQGAANIVVPFFGGIPITGAIARTMTNINNGGRTPVAGIIHAIVLLLILLFLSPLTSHIPMACLAGVLVMVSYNMSEWRTFRSLLHGSRSDVAVLVSTFLLTVVFDLTIAILIGLLMAMLLFMRRIVAVTEVSVAR
ncbi:MAG: SulP family inorganic anion transporter, partial [Rikenellaceae bacterium]